MKVYVIFVNCEFQLFRKKRFTCKHFTLQKVGKDDFGSDPFASLHAPTGQGQVLSPGAQKGPPPRPESPSPALPPKKSKQPPPRPAPPRPLQVNCFIHKSTN